VDRADALFRRELRGARDELMFPETAEWHIEDAGEPVTNVVRVQHRSLGDFLEPVSTHPEDVRVRPHQEREVAVTRANLPYRLRSIVIQVVAPTVEADDRDRQERLERFLHADGSGARSASAMGRREGLVQIEMDDIEVHVAGRGAAEDRVEVR